MDYNVIAYFCTIIGVIITLGAQLFINLEYSIYRRMNNSKGISGKDAARVVLDKNGLNNVKVESVAGTLTDHYDPTAKTVRLSQYNYNGTSIAAVAVACHECGHAIQDKENYTFLRIRTMLCPIVNFATNMAYILFIISVFLQAVDLLMVAVAVISLSLIFQVVTLPVEFNASKRALEQLKKLEIVDEKEHMETEKVLKAAALTYVAAVLSSILNLVRLLLEANNRRN